FPEEVARVVTLEGLGFDWRSAKPAEAQLRDWVLTSRSFEDRQPRTFATLGEAEDRMKAANPHLSGELAEHLARHGTRQTDDGSCTWKLDPFTRSDFAFRANMEDVAPLWRAVRCPVLVLWGDEGWKAEFGETDALAQFADAEGAM